MGIAIMVTGGWRDCRKADAAVAKHDTFIIGLCRPLCADPFLPRLWLKGINNPTATIHFYVPFMKNLIISGLSWMWHRQCLVNLGRNRKRPSTHWSYLALLIVVQSIRMYIWDPR